MTARSHLQQLEAESLHIMREVAAECQRPVLLYSIGKDSSVLLRLAQKAFYPGAIPFPLLHIDTGYKFREMIDFRDRYTAELGLNLIVHTNRAALNEGANPFNWGTQRCCGALKTTALLDGLRAGGFDAAIGGARRDEERSRAKERVFSFRDRRGQWDPRNQRPELWNIFNTRIHEGESLRVFPLSNWTEMDVWQYIHAEKIPIVPLYFAKPRLMLERGDSLLPVEQTFVPRIPGEEAKMVMCRMRSLGCSPCTGAIRSDADTVPLIIEELVSMRRSERQNRVIDHDQDGSMELKKQGRLFLMASTLVANSETFSEFLEREKGKDLLRFTTAGSVDDGKSTLIGRLLYDSRSVYDDQLESVTKASAGRNAGAIDFSLLTDGLRAEREQGITIDVAYRYFATPRRKFIIADTPGHEQYTRNMVTGASTAELAIVLVDARKGVLPQSRRHSYIAGLLGIERVAIAVNKMDLVGYDESVFTGIEKDFLAILARFPRVQPYFVPVSALAGDNVVTRSKNMPWFDGPSLLEHLETVPVGGRLKSSAFRFPVQRVVRPSHEFRGYAGTIVAGSVQPGDAVTILPSGRETTIASIVTFDGNLNYADAGQAVTLTLSQEIDLSRGDFIVSSQGQPIKAHGVKATLVWLNEKPAEIGGRYRIKHASRQDWATLRQIDYRLNINTLEQDSVYTLEMNAIGQVTLETARLFCFDLYEDNRATGSFVLIDAATNATVAAGMITGLAETSVLAPLAGIAWHVKDGALVLTSEQGFTTKPGLSDEPLAMEDPEALEALRHMLRRLRVAPFGGAGESDFEI